VTLTRVEWTRLSGDDAETLLSVLLYSKHPRAVRVRPSRGDGGVDVLVPHPDQPGKTDVYQIKKFAENLTSSQKDQIERSYRRLMMQLADAKIAVANWYLLMPLDPTPENRIWFGELPARVLQHLHDVHQRPEAHPKESITAEGFGRVQAWQDDPATGVEWKGFIACEALAAAYPNVVDYYLHGGRGRLESAVRMVAALLGTDRNLHRDADGPDVQPADLREHLRTVQAVLDTDPHFRYGISLDPSPPALTAEPNLIAATQEIGRDGSCLTFRIFARFAEALNERPVPLHLTFTFENKSEELAAFELWMKYGKPVTLPVRVDADLPGGLGGVLERGTVSISASADRETYRLRYRLVSPAGEPLAQIVLEMEPPASGQDRTGMWTRGADLTGTFQIESFFDLETRTARLDVTFGDLTGTRVTDALTAGKFEAHWQGGNRLEISGEQGPFSPFLEIDTEIQSPFDPLILRILQALSTIQGRCHDVILVPDFTQMPRDQIRKLIDAAALINGQTFVGTWQEVPFTPLVGAPVCESELEVAILQNYRADINTSTHFLGVATTWLASAKMAATGPGYVLRPARSDGALVTLDVNAPELPSSEPNIKVRLVTGQ
jgi:hypothetical protein